MELKLPLSVVDRHDVLRMSREIAAIDEFMLQARLRKPGEGVALPRISSILEETSKLNALNLLNEPDRKKLKDSLLYIKDHAPTIHMSFAVEPSTVVSSRIVEWFRTKIDPATLVKFGLQPTIAAGCTMRTYSKYYDLSLRKTLERQRDKLIALVRQEDPVIDITTPAYDPASGKAPPPTAATPGIPQETPAPVAETSTPAPAMPIDPNIVRQEPVDASEDAAAPIQATQPAATSSAGAPVGAIPPMPTEAAYAQPMSVTPTQEVDVKIEKAA